MIRVFMFKDITSCHHHQRWPSRQAARFPRVTAAVRPAEVAEDPSSGLRSGAHAPVDQQDGQCTQLYAVRVFELPLFEETAIETAEKRYIGSLHIILWYGIAIYAKSTLLYGFLI